MTAPNIRRRFFSYLVIIGTLLGCGGLFTQMLAQPADMHVPIGRLLTLDGPVTPTTADYLTREIEAANQADVKLVIIEIDTPGGLVTAMQKIIKSVFASEIPVVTYVAPQGARSASAGLYIMYSAHISAMAPATNTGAATPIELGKDDQEGVPFDWPMDTSAPDQAPAEKEADGYSPTAAPNVPPTNAPAMSNKESLRAKMINDSAAYIRSLAEQRNRNAQWAEKAVHEAASITAAQALTLNVIDIVADDLDDLLRQIDGRTVETAAGPVTLETKGMILDRVAPTMLERIFGFFADPNVAAILISLGTTGLIIEMWNPGSLFPGAVGALCLILAFYSFGQLPFNVVPLAIMGVGAVLLVTEIFATTFGVAGLFGLTIFGTGLYFLFPGEFRVSLVLLYSLIGIIAAFLGVVLMAIVRSHGHGPLIGSEAIRKRIGIIEDWNTETGSGHVIVDGERWRARSDKPVALGDTVKILEIDGLVLVVRRALAKPHNRFMPTPAKPSP